MSMFTAYFDESDSGDASVVAGFIGEAPQLNHFNNREWKQLLESENLGYFHMKEFAHSTNEFRDWKGDEARRRNFLARIIGILSRRARIIIGVLIDRSAYKQACYRSNGFASFYVNEYTAAGFMSLLKCANWAEKRGVTEPIDFVFDNGNPKRPDFQRAFDLCKSTPSADACHFGSLTFADDKMILPLQAADFIAYEICKVYTDMKYDKRRFRESMRNLLATVPANVSIASQDMLLKLTDKIDSVQ
jgi:hypothetical protein